MKRLMALALAGLALLPLPASSACDNVDVLTAQDGRWSVFRFMKPGGHDGVTVSLTARQVDSSSRVETFTDGSWSRIQAGERKKATGVRVYGSAILAYEYETCVDIIELEDK